jgi:hypothetical protein
MAGLGWVAALVLAAACSAQHPGGHGMHPLMPGQRVVFRVKSETETGEVPLDVRAAEQQTAVDQKLLSAGGSSLRLVRLLPHALLEQKVLPDEAGAASPAIEISIVGPAQSFRRWLQAGDPERNRLTSYIGTWRYMAVGDDAERSELFEQFETEYSRPPQLWIGRAGDSHALSLPLQLNETRKPAGLDCEIRVLQFLPDAAMASAGGPVNRSQRRRNPAVQVEIRQADKTEVRWVFAKFPAFNEKPGNMLPFQLRLECPVEGPAEAPDFVLVTMARDRHELWTRIGHRAAARAIAPGEKIEITGSPYLFEISTVVAHAKMVEIYRPDEKGKAPPAIELEYVNEQKQPASMWLPLGHHRRLLTVDGPVMASLILENESPSLAHP